MGGARGSGAGESTSANRPQPAAAAIVRLAYSADCAVAGPGRAYIALPEDGDSSTPFTASQRLRPRMTDTGVTPASATPALVPSPAADAAPEVPTLYDWAGGIDALQRLTTLFYS